MTTPETAPGSTTDALRAHLAAAGFQLVEEDWRNPLEGVWSVQVRDADCPLFSAGGTGSTQAAALADALLAFAGKLSFGHFQAGYYLGEDSASANFAHDPHEKWFALDGEWDWPRALLTPQLQAFYNPDGNVDAESLVDMNTGDRERGICALPHVRLRDGQTVHVPVNVISNLYASNGTAAGHTAEEARLAALTGLIAQHVKLRVIREGLCLPTVPEEVIARHPAVAAAIRTLRDAGFGVLIRDASLGGVFPVVSMALLNPHDQGVRVSFDADPRFGNALHRALLGLLQGRTLDTLNGFPPPSHDPQEVASTANTIRHFTDSTGSVPWNFLASTAQAACTGWGSDATPAEDFERLAQLLQEAGNELLIAEHAHAGIHACRIIAPGFSEIHPLDQLDFDNDSIGNDLRPSILQWQQMNDAECADLLEALDDIDMDEEKRVAGLIGLAADEGTLWADLRVGELKCLLGFATGNEAAIEAGLQWVAGCAQLDPARRRIYTCIETVLRLGGGEHHLAALATLYGEDTLALAMGTLCNDLRFLGTPSPGMALDGCEMHARLLAACDKRRRYMQ